MGSIAGGGKPVVKKDIGTLKAVDRKKRTQESSFDQREVELDDQRKRVFVSLSILAAMPISAIYAIGDLYHGRTGEGLFLLSMDLLLVTILALLKYVKKIDGLLRFCGVIAISLLIFELAVGGGEGYAFLWFYFYPISFFYVFGKREGVLWTATAICVLTLLPFSGLSRFNYSIDLGLRIVLTYSIVAGLSYALESARDHYYRSLLKEKRLLEHALAEVKTLSGLLPLCAHCKKVRDDQGYWNQLEAYIMAHSDADFSHGICPECAEKFYPEMDLYGTNEKEDAD